MLADESLSILLQRMLTAAAQVTLHVHSKTFATGASAARLRGYFDELVELVTEANDGISKKVPKKQLPAEAVDASPCTGCGSRTHLQQPVQPDVVDDLGRGVQRAVLVDGAKPGNGGSAVPERLRPVGRGTVFTAGRRDPGDEQGPKV